MNFPEGCTAIEIGEVPPLKGEPNTDLKLPDDVSTRYAAIALACGTAKKAFRPAESLPPPLLPPQLASQASAQARAKTVPTSPPVHSLSSSPFQTFGITPPPITDFGLVPCAPSAESCPSGTPG